MSMLTFYGRLAKNHSFVRGTLILYTPEHKPSKRVHAPVKTSFVDCIGKL